MGCKESKLAAVATGNTILLNKCEEEKPSNYPVEEEKSISNGDTVLLTSQKTGDEGTTFVENAQDEDDKPNPKDAISAIEKNVEEKNVDSLKENEAVSDPQDDAVLDTNRQDDAVILQPDDAVAEQQDDAVPEQQELDTVTVKQDYDAVAEQQEHDTVAVQQVNAVAEQQEHDTVKGQLETDAVAEQQEDDAVEQVNLTTGA